MYFLVSIKSHEVRLVRPEDNKTDSLSFSYGVLFHIIKINSLRKPCCAPGVPMPNHRSWVHHRFLTPCCRPSKRDGESSPCDQRRLDCQKGMKNIRDHHDIASSVDLSSILPALLLRRTSRPVSQEGFRCDCAIPEQFETKRDPWKCSGLKKHAESLAYLV